MSAETDDDRKSLARLPPLVSAPVAALLGVAERPGGEAARARTEAPVHGRPVAPRAVRDAVHGRLRPATQERAEKVAVGGGYGSLIQ